MNILGIESSSLVASVAVATEDVVIGEYTVKEGRDPLQDCASVPPRQRGWGWRLKSR